MKQELESLIERMRADRERLVAASLEHYKAGKYYQADLMGDRAKPLRKALKHLEDAKRLL